VVRSYTNRNIPEASALAKLPSETADRIPGKLDEARQWAERLVQEADVDTLLPRPIGNALFALKDLQLFSCPFLTTTKPLRRTVDVLTLGNNGTLRASPAPVLSGNLLYSPPLTISRGPRTVDTNGEAELLIALRARDPKAIRCFVRAQTGPMHAVARRLLGTEDEAREVVQEAFLRAFQSLDQFRGSSRLGTWLHRIVVNEALMWLRARKAKAGAESLDALLPRFYEDGHRMAPMPAWSEPVDVLLQRGEVRELVRRSIERLPETLRVVLVLRDIEDIDVKETAAMLEVNEGVVKTRLHRARQALRALLEKELVV
jgi:RNA polymerase sigma-70 factor (ECF subfamily)